MNVTDSSLTRATAAATAVAGAIFIAVQINHPGSHEFTTETSQWVARCSAKMVMAALALAGTTGLYLRQRRHLGLLGLAGYLLFAAGYLCMFAVEVIAVTVLPALVDSNPGFVNDVVAAAMGNHPSGDIGATQTLFNANGIGYLLGGLVFGIAMFRARVLARWAAALLAVATVSTVALAFLPEGFDRPFAIPTGIALIGLGVSLWRNPSDETVAPAVAPAPVREPAVR
jgi:hypothetical protein